MGLNGRINDTLDFILDEVKASKRIIENEIYKNNSLKLKKSKSIFKLVRQLKNTSIVSVDLYTGRTHQIRVHTSASGFPIVGDLKYSSMTLNSDMEKRMYLHCSSLEILEKDLKITSKVPNSFFQPFEV